MKAKLNCEIVKDLLPSYIDRLTSETTNEAVEAHLAECEECCNVYRKMTNAEPQFVQQQEIDYLKKVHDSRRRIFNVAILAGCAVLALGILSAVIAGHSRRKAETDAQTIDELEKQTAADANTISELEMQIALPTVLYDAEAKSLVIMGTDRYDEAVIPDEAEEAVTLDVQDDQFHMSVYIPLLYRNGEPLKTYLPVYIDRTDKSIRFIRDYLKEHAKDVYPTESADKMVELNIRKEESILFRNEEDRILVNLGSAYWNRDGFYIQAMMGTPHRAWGQIGLSWYMAGCIDPYSDFLVLMDPSATTPYDDLYAAAGGKYENWTNDDIRIQFDVISRVCLDKGLVSKRWGTPMESAPLTRIRGYVGSPETYEQDVSMSPIMAASFVGWLDRQYGFAALAEYCFEKATFEEAFETDFDTAFAAWKAWITETYPIS